MTSENSPRTPVDGTAEDWLRDREWVQRDSAVPSGDRILEVLDRRDERGECGRRGRRRTRGCGQRAAAPGRAPAAPGSAACGTRQGTRGTGHAPPAAPGRAPAAPGSAPRHPAGRPRHPAVHPRRPAARLQRPAGHPRPRQCASGTRQRAAAAGRLHDRRHHQALEQVDGLTSAQLVGGLHHVVDQAAAATAAVPMPAAAPPAIAAAERRRVTEDRIGAVGAGVQRRVIGTSLAPAPVGLRAVGLRLAAPVSARSGWSAPGSLPCRPSASRRCPGAVSSQASSGG